MVLSEENVRKVVKHRVCSLAIHPSESVLLVAAGDSFGHVGLWNMVSCGCALGLVNGVGGIASSIVCQA